MKKAIVATLLVGYGFCRTVHADDSISVEAGTGNMADLVRIALINSWDSEYPILKDHQLRPLWAVSVTEITEQKYQNRSGVSRSLTDFGFTPLLRWQGTLPHPVYAELGIGINYMTEKYDNNGRTMSSNFQFGDHIGAGYVFSNGVDMMLNFQHYSDAGIKRPNPAVNFVNLRLNYPL